MSVKVEILDYKYTDATNTVIDWDNSVVGELDITDHSDFPLAMTFQISDFKDVTATSGDYSKTFKIPATKNNNQIFKNLYIPNINVNNKITDKKPCRILVNNLYSQVGLIKVNGVGGYGETPSYYNCVFFGNNLSWAADLQDSYMDSVVWGSEGEDLGYNKNSIVATWQYEDSDNASNSPIVYPITSYGEYNPEGIDRTIQLLDTWSDAGNNASSFSGYFGFRNDGTSYETPLPSPDWRPAIFVKNTLDKIFNEVGYKISSTFMDTAMFKKLVWLLPNFKYNNPDDRYSKYAAEVNFDTAVSLPVIELEENWSTGGTYPYSKFDSNNVELGVSGTSFNLSSTTASTEITYTGGADSYFEVAEYGKYKVTASGLSARLSNLLHDNVIPTPHYVIVSGSATARSAEFYIDRIQFKIQVQTVGQTSWNTIGMIEDVTTESFVGSVGTYGTFGINLIDSTSYYDWSVNDVIEVETFLNNGDKLRILFTAEFRPHPTVSSWTSDGDWSFDVTPIVTSLDISLDPSNVAYGQTYDLSEVMNPDDKQIDFIKGVAHAFNLQMTTDETTKTVNIEPFDTFYKPYKDAIDWTYKLDRSNEISDKWIENELKRTLVFKYKSDSKDAVVKIRGERFFHNIEDEYPYREILPDTFERGDSTFENPFFAGTFNAKDLTSSGSSNESNDPPYSACLWEENASPNYNSRPDKGFEFLPRLLYWNKYSPAATFASGIATTKRGQVQTWANTSESIVADSTANIGVLSNIYPQATMLNRDSTTSPNLAYGNAWVRDYDDSTEVYTAYQSGKGLYDTYYRSMIEMLKVSPRLRTVSVSLKVSDIVNLDFRKLVYIDGVYWRINRIVDYMPNQNSSTKVELIEWLQLGVFAASAPAYGSSGGSSRWGLGGSLSTTQLEEPVNTNQGF